MTVSTKVIVLLDIICCFILTEYSEIKIRLRLAIQLSDNTIVSELHFKRYNCLNGCMRASQYHSLVVWLPLLFSAAKFI